MRQLEAKTRKIENFFFPMSTLLIGTTLSPCLAHRPRHSRGSAFLFRGTKWAVSFSRQRVFRCVRCASTTRAERQETQVRTHWWNHPTSAWRRRSDPKHHRPYLTITTMRIGRHARCPVCSTEFLRKFEAREGAGRSRVDNGIRYE